MKYYRITDSRWEPYATGYNYTTLIWLAMAIYDLWQEFFDEEGWTEGTILNELEEGNMEIGWYIVQEQDEPFPEDEKPQF